MAGRKKSVRKKPSSFRTRNTNLKVLRSRLRSSGEDIQLTSSVHRGRKPRRKK